MSENVKKEQTEFKKTLQELVERGTFTQEQADNYFEKYGK